MTERVRRVVRVVSDVALGTILVALVNIWGWVARDDEVTRWERLGLGRRLGFGCRLGSWVDSLILHEHDIADLEHGVSALAHAMRCHITMLANAVSAESKREFIVLKSLEEWLKDAWALIDKLLDCAALGQDSLDLCELRFNEFL